MSAMPATNQAGFPEGIVTPALADYLGISDSPNRERMEWFFGLKARTKSNPKKLSELCGFDWREGEIDGEHESPFTLPRDKGQISEDHFKKIYWQKAADFRFWTKKRDQQLIVEAKGTAKPLKKDAEQAKRYFAYMREFPAKGAVVYFVPGANLWFNWLEKMAEESGVMTEEAETKWGLWIGTRRSYSELPLS